MAKNKKKRSKNQKWWTFLKIQIVLIILVLGGIGFYYLSGYAEVISKMRKEASSCVSKSSEETFKKNQTSIAYDCNGNTISVLKGAKDSYYVTLEDTPPYVEQAFICVEDKKFRNHSGIDFKGIARAVWELIKNRKVSSGGSTITQQLARNVFLSQEVTWQRKVKEIFIASELEKKYSKDQIMEYYINNIYFGNGYYGIQAASKGYFGKPVSELSLSQIAFLAGIPNNPTEFDPRVHLDNAVARRNIVLGEMLEDRAISKDSYDKAMQEPIELFTPEEVHNNYAETFTFYCATRALMAKNGFKFKYDFKSDAAREEYYKEYNEAYDRYNNELYTGGYRIYTSLDMNMQQELQNAIDQGLAAYGEVGDDGIFTLQGAGTCIDNETGLVKAIVGGRTQNIPGYTLNRAYQSFRQPGSAIKPLIVYTPCLERGYTADTSVVDAREEGGPKNADGSYSGTTNLRTAVMLSKNTVAWRLFAELGPAVGISYLKEMEFSKLDANDNNLAASLGGFTHGVSTLEMAKAYATLENDGMYRDGTCVVAIKDAKGNEVYKSEQQEKEIYRKTAAREMTDILQLVVSQGTGAGLGVGGQPTAGKTGTTNDNVDGWFCGYTPYYSTAVWVGYDMPKKLPGLYGSSYPGGIWKNFMNAIHSGLERKDFPGVENVGALPVEQSINEQ